MKETLQSDNRPGQQVARCQTEADSELRQLLTSRADNLREQHSQWLEHAEHPIEGLLDCLGIPRRLRYEASFELLESLSEEGLASVIEAHISQQAVHSGEEARAFSDPDEKD